MYKNLFHILLAGLTLLSACVPTVGLDSPSRERDIHAPDFSLSATSGTRNAATVITQPTFTVSIDKGQPERTYQLVYSIDGKAAGEMVNIWPGYSRTVHLFQNLGNGPHTLTCSLSWEDEEETLSVQRNVDFNMDIEKMLSYRLTCIVNPEDKQYDDKFDCVSVKKGDTGYLLLEYAPSNADIEILSVKSPTRRFVFCNDLSEIGSIPGAIRIPFEAIAPGEETVVIEFTDGTNKDSAQMRFFVSGKPVEEEEEQEDDPPVDPQEKIYAWSSKITFDIKTSGDVLINNYYDIELGYTGRDEPIEYNIAGINDAALYYLNFTGNKTRGYFQKLGPQTFRVEVKISDYVTYYKDFSIVVWGKAELYLNARYMQPGNTDNSNIGFYFDNINTCPCTIDLAVIVKGEGIFGKEKTLNLFETYGATVQPGGSICVGTFNQVYDWVYDDKAVKNHSVHFYASCRDSYMHVSMDISQIPAIAYANGVDVATYVNDNRTDGVIDIL